MAKKVIHALRTRGDYEAALDEIEVYFDREPRPGTVEAGRFDQLARVIEDYEKKHWPIDSADTTPARRAPGSARATRPR